MSLKYFEEEMRNYPSSRYDGSFIGYITPQDELLNYSSLIGRPHHGDWVNPVTPTFLDFVSYAVIGDSLENHKGKYWDIYKNNEYPGFDCSVLRGPINFKANALDYPTFKEYLNNAVNKIKEMGRTGDEWSKLEYDLMDFFEKCYSNDDFFGSFGRIISILSKENALNLKSFHDSSYFEDEDENNIYFQKYFYKNYRIMTLMSYFKDILVQYLGYDSIRSVEPRTDIYVWNNIYDNLNGYQLSEHPVIITSCRNPNERFYNWLLMDWEVQRIPRMIWLEEAKKYVQESELGDFHYSEKELVLSDEIETIRKRVPLQDRKKFFR